MSTHTGVYGVTNNVQEAVVCGKVCAGVVVLIIHLITATETAWRAAEGKAWRRGGQACRRDGGTVSWWRHLVILC
jgi:hypothetical protein